MRKSPWWDDADSKVTNVIRSINNVMQDDEQSFMQILARAEKNYELTQSELGAVTRHFTARWQRDNLR